MEKIITVNATATGEPVNLAYRKTTSQSSTAHTGHSWKTVDGDTDTNYYVANYYVAGSVTHTAGTEKGDRWWKVLTLTLTLTLTLVLTLILTLTLIGPVVEGRPRCIVRGGQDRDLWPWRCGVGPAHQF